MIEREMDDQIRRSEPECGSVINRERNGIDPSFGPAGGAGSRGFLTQSASSASLAYPSGMIEAGSPRYGLDASLLVPIAARDVAAIEQYVGAVQDVVYRRSGQPAALLIEAHDQAFDRCEKVPLWKHADAATFRDRLFPRLQVWVHVDYSRYRWAYEKLMDAPLSTGEVLDHVQNRAAIRLRWYSHPLLRLCPVSRSVNSSGGHAKGGEGMERRHLKSVLKDPERSQRLREHVFSYRVAYADPMDLTKMLNQAPGTAVLEGVRATQQLFYP